MLRIRRGVSDFRADGARRLLRDFQSMGWAAQWRRLLCKVHEALSVQGRESRVPRVGWANGDGPVRLAFTSPRLNSPLPPPPSSLRSSHGHARPPHLGSPPARHPLVPLRCGPVPPSPLPSSCDRSRPRLISTLARALSPAVHRLTRLPPTRSTATRCRSERCGQACVSPLLLQAAMRADPDLTSPASQLAHRPHTACESMHSVTCSLCDLQLTKRTSPTATSRRRGDRQRPDAVPRAQQGARPVPLDVRAPPQRVARPAHRRNGRLERQPGPRRRPLHCPRRPLAHGASSLRIPLPLGPSPARLGSSGSQQSSRRGADPPLDHPRARRALTTS